MDQLVRAHKTQSVPVKVPKAFGANGVLPLASQHSSLCLTVSALNASGITGQVIQVGHWTACPWVYSQALAIGNPSGRGVLEGALLVATELEPGALEALVETADSKVKYITHDLTERNRDRNDLVWHPVRPIDAVWSPGAVGRSLGSGVFMWRASDFLLRQRQVSSGKLIVDASPASGTLAWHVVLKEPLLPGNGALGVPGPSEYFKHHNNSYWTDGNYDYHCPINKWEHAQGPQEVCAPCVRALDGLARDALVLAPIQAPIQAIESIEALSLNEFFI